MNIPATKAQVQALRNKESLVSNFPNRFQRKNYFRKPNTGSRKLTRGRRFFIVRESPTYWTSITGKQHKIKGKQIGLHRH